MSQPNRDKAKLFPPFADVLLDFENRLAAAKLPFYLFEGYRSWERQGELWAQGRTKPGPIVTWAPPGHSFHFCGMASDYVYFLNGQWSWDLSGDRRELWRQMASLARECGMEAGWFWTTKKVDPPHIQARYGMTIDEARALYLQAGLPVVWERAQSWIEDRTWP